METVIEIAEIVSIDDDSLTVKDTKGNIHVLTGKYVKDQVATALELWQRRN